MSAEDRRTRTHDADAHCAAAYTGQGGPDTGAALVAVGGYGRGELAPYSDWDVVLVHDDGVDVTELASTLWYPLWDLAPKLDHSVRSFTAMVEAADADLKVAMGLLNIRHLAGDPNLTLRLRTTMLAQWRRQAPHQLGALRELVQRRHELMGELAHASVPDLKEAAGGLRDAVVLDALAATWLVDVPATELAGCRRELLDVRDHVQAVAGRAADRIAPEMWEPLAQRLGVADERAAQAHVRGLGRRTAHLSRLVWRRVAARPTQPSKRSTRPVVVPLGDGVGLVGGEVVLDVGAQPGRDPLLLLRAAVAAAERNLVLAPATAARLAREVPELPTPWPAGARRLLVRLLASGRGLLHVWETLDQTGAVDRILPEWERIRLLPHASIVHRYTVDRHVIETCIEASALIRQVARPDVLLVAALLHDIGKGELTEHSVAGAPLARAVAERMGFDVDAAELIALLVRWHLLLSTTATTRDPDDPATVDLIASTVHEPDALALLTALTEADARATSPKAWSSWRAGLILDLAGRAMRVLDAGVAAPVSAPDLVEIPPELKAREQADAEADARAGEAHVHVHVEPTPDGTRVTLIAPDRVGLMADASATFALQRASLRAVRAWAQDSYAVSVWDLDAERVDPALVRTRFEGIAAGRIDPADRWAGDTSGLEPSVVVRPEASTQATVMEVRTEDRPGIVYVVCAALARLEIAVRSAHVDTLGPQAVDVFYLQEAQAGVLSDRRAAEAVHAVRAALSGVNN